MACARRRLLSLCVNGSADWRLAAISAPISCQRWLCAASSSGAPGSSCSARTLRLRPSTIACAQRSARWLRVSGAASAGWPVGSLGAFMPAIVLQARVRRILGHGTSGDKRARARRSEEHTSELQSLMRISYAVFCLKKKTIKHNTTYDTHHNNLDNYNLRKS